MAEQLDLDFVDREGLAWMVEPSFGPPEAVDHSDYDGWPVTPPAAFVFAASAGDCSALALPELGLELELGLGQLGPALVVQLAGVGALQHIGVACSVVEVLAAAALLGIVAATCQGSVAFPSSYYYFDFAATDAAALRLASSHAAGLFVVVAA